MRMASYGTVIATRNLARVILSWQAQIKTTTISPPDILNVFATSANPRAPRPLEFPIAYVDPAATIALADRLGGFQNLPIAPPEDVLVEFDFALGYPALRPLPKLVSHPPQGRGREALEGGEEGPPPDATDSAATDAPSVPVAALEATGQAFWEQLPGEPSDAYRLFVAYRSLADLPALVAARLPMMSLRSISAVAAQSGLSGEYVADLAVIYHWNLRAKAYDHFQSWQQEAQRLIMVRKTENVHWKTARMLFQRILKWLNEHMDELDPATALQWFQTAIKLERISLGLPADKPLELANSGSGTQVSVQVAQFQTQAQAQQSVASAVEGAKKLFQDPEAADLANRLLERMGRRVTVGSEEGR